MLYLAKSKLNIREKILLLIPFGLILINIKFFDFFSTAIKPIHFIVVLIIINALCSRIDIKNAVILWVYLLIPLLAFNNIISFKEFMFTYAIYILSLLLVLIGIKPFLKVDELYQKKMFAILFKMFNISAIYGLIQFILANVFDDFRLYNNLGTFQYHMHLDNEIFGIIRATSIYIEPSVFSWIATTVLVLLLYLRKACILKPKAYKLTVLLCIVSIFISFSAAGLIAFSCIIFIYTFFGMKTTSAFFLRILLVFGVFAIFLFQPAFLKYLRLSEIFIPGKSGYFRIIEPFNAMIEAIKVYPVFGRGLGQIGVYDRKLVYNILIHNSFFGVFIIFGISALAYIIPILTSFYRAIKRDKMVLILVADLFFVFIATGSFLSLEMPLIYCIFLTAVNYKQKYKGMNNYEI